MWKVTVEVTDSDVYDSTVTPTWFNHTDAGAVNATVPFTTAFLSVPKAIRFNGTATNFEAIIVQNGH